MNMRLRNPFAVRRLALLLCAAAGAPLAPAPAQSLPGGVFVIEAEDFNHGSGQHRPAASTMPYLGGAYQGLGATHNIDYRQPTNVADANEYRTGETPNVPMTGNPDLDRGPWQVTVNYRIGWTDNGDWYNYTRVFPAGHYKIFAALSYDGTEPGQLKGSLQRVTGATTTTQTLEQLGTFDAPGSGGWGLNNLVPLKAPDGTLALVFLDGEATLRYTAVSGDIDYYKLVRAGPPQIAQQPADLSVTENRAATFVVVLGGDEPATFQWQRNSVDIPGATRSNYTFTATLADSGTKFRCLVANPLGSVTSREATLTVTRDTTGPKLVSARNLGPTTVVLAFDEGVTVPGGAASASFALDQGVSVSGAAAGATTTEIVLTVSTLTYGALYTVTVNHVADLASQPNPIAPNSRIQFIASEFVPADIGGPALAGGVVRLPGGGYEVTAGGRDIGGTSDQFHFGWELKSGDFDLQARVASVTVSDAFVHAGLMARETLDANARFGAVFASSAQLGCFFESRASVGATTTTATFPGGFPVNYPQTWLRLRRSGSALAGFASLDGRAWVQLGSISLSGLAGSIYVGLAVTSDNPAATTKARFLDVGPTVSTTTTTTFASPAEPLGPSSRATGIVISEIMYHPKARADGRNLEFVELYNARSVFEDLSGWRLSGEIDFTFPEGFKLEAGEFVVVAAAPDDLKAVYGLSNVLGPYTHSLPNEGGTLRLRNNLDAIRLEVNYSDDPPWPAAADGAGHSLVLTRPSFGENNVLAWGASEWMGGSPGDVDPVYFGPLRSVAINEFLAHTDDPVPDFIELYNRANVEVDVSGCVLTDDPSTNKFRMPPGTWIPARGFLAFDQTTLGFALRSGGETIYLVNPEGTRVLDAVRFGGQENGVSSGRSPDGAPTLRRLATPTPGSPNGPWRVEEVVINEIMFNPISTSDDDEYVELHNRSSRTIDLSGWRFVEGIKFKVPPHTTLPPGGFLVVAKNAMRLLSNYPQLSARNTVGDYDGTLSNRGERIALAKPDLVTTTNELGQIITNEIHIVVAEVTYNQGGRWGQYADGGGSSLELIDPRADPLHPSNWADSDESQKAEWTSAEFTGRLDHGSNEYQPNRLHISMQGAGECLVDDVEIFRVGSTNLLSNGGFESGTLPGATGFAFNGNHSRSVVREGGAFSGNRCLHVRALGDGDTGVNSIRTTLTAGLSANVSATLRAKVRWLGGWPEILFRTRGNWIEMPVRMRLPKNLGTPGLPNSRLVANAGPAIYAVSHSPALPRVNQAVLVTCRVSDPDGVAAVTLQYRVDPATTLTAVLMRDDGTGGDEIAGDGVYSATISGRASRTLVAFRVEASDAGTPAATSVFPAKAPEQEGLIRWDDPIPFGNLAHYHLWSTAATESARRNALDNTYRDATLVYGHFRVIYNVGFRDKGSPWHGGQGDFALNVPPDDLLLGATERVVASTGNGDSEGTAIRSQLAAWLHQQMGVPYLHAHYTRFYRNGTQFRNVTEDLEQPDHDYAERWFPAVGEGDLYKIAMWFEFQDDNRTFGAVSATLERFLTAGNAYKLARYRWNFQRRPNDGLANNYTNIFDLVTAANDTSANYVPRLLTLADLEQWMRVFSCGWIMGDWDMWSYGVGQNMYLYKPSGVGSKLMRWDIDFTFGLGNGPTSSLWGGQDPVVNRMYDTPAFRRMLWRAYLDATRGPLLPEHFQPQIDARRNALLKNGITGLSTPASITSFINQRRTYILNQLRANDTPLFAITSNNGNDFTSTQPTARLAGTAPFAVAAIAVNGTPYPVTWTDPRTFQLTVPLPERVNRLVLQGLDRLGNPIASATDTITVTYTGVIQQPQDYVVINEIHYNPLEPGASFLELFNRSTTTPFDLSGCRLDGLGYTFADGAVIQPNSYLLIVKDRQDFANAYGQTLVVFDEFPGRLDNGGEHLLLVKPGATPAEDVVISDVRYDDRLPWPPNADGLGPSLQLIDAAQDEFRVGNWMATATNDVQRVTPGRANAGRQILEPFPLLWINELVAHNVSGRTDNAGEREPWIELYNAGATTLDLSALYLTDNYTNLTRWQFPAGTTIGPKQFLIVWADGEAGESAAGAPHTNFRLDPSSGSVALVRMQGFPSAPAVMDYADYALLAPDRSFGCVPDGEPRKRRPLHIVTPGAANDPSSPVIKVTINEFMAANTRIVDPADNDSDEDWFELYNAGSQPVDLTGYTLTDDLTRPAKFVVPAGTIIPAGGFLLAWADEETRQNQPGADLHVNFKLSLTNEVIGLFAPDGTLVDSIEYGPQTPDVSMGRYPDGADPPLIAMEFPTPRERNLLPGGNRPPVLNPIGHKSVAEQTLLSFTVSGSDPDAGQTISFTLGADAPPGASLDPITGLFTWTPSEAQGPGNYTFAIRVTDNGLPARTASERITVSVSEVNRAPVLAAIPDQTVDEGSLLTVPLSATDPDLPANPLTFRLAAGAPDGVALDETAGVLTWTPAEHQGPGSYTLTVSVTDNAAPPLSDARSFRVMVNEVNNPPVFDFIQAQTVEELKPFTLTVRAVDPDNAQSPILYSLETAPPGAQIDPATGLIAWTPTEAQGPANAIFVVRATETTPPGLTATRTFSVAVTEKNEWPALVPIPDQTVLEGQTLAVQILAADPDLPPQPLTFSLDPGTPPGMTIDAATGLLTWVVPPDHGAGAHLITVAVADNGTPPLGATRGFRVTVRTQPHVVINEIMYAPPQARAQFIELHNNSAVTTEDLSGARLRGASLNFTFATGTRLAPGAFLVVAKDQAAYAAAYPGAPPPLGVYAGDLGANGDTLRVIKPGATPAQDTVLDEVSFAAHAPWPSAAAGQGASLQLIDPTQDNRRVGNWAAVAGLSPLQPRNLIVMTNAWKFDQSGVDLSAAFRDPAFNDNAWPSGQALFYVETAALPAPKNTPLTLGQLTYYFRTRFQYVGPTLGVTLRLSTVLDDGAAVYLNGQPLFRLGVPEGTLTYDTLADRTVGDAVLEGPFTLPGDALRQGENVLAVEVHQVNSTSSDIVFGMTLDVEGGNVAPYTPGAANSVRAPLPPFPRVWLNEVLPNNATGLTDRLGDRDPWIELFNAGADAVSLAGYYLTDNFAELPKWPFPAGGTISPGQFLLVWADGEPGEQTAGEWHTNFRLHPATGSLALVRIQNGQPAVMDYLNYAVALADEAFGATADGEPGARQVLAAPTPRAPNSPAPGELRFAEAAWLANGTFRLVWTARPGHRYQVEFKNALAEPAWQVLDELTASGETAAAVDSTVLNTAQRYYRVRRLN